MTDTTLAPLPVPVGTVVEFFEAGRILLGICMAVKGTRLSVVAETGREFNLARNRVLHFSRRPLDWQAERAQLQAQMRAIGQTRQALSDKVDIVELWSLLRDEPDRLTSEQLAELVFSGPISDHHVAALQRVMLQDKLYFQFKDGAFQARSEQQVQERTAQLEREAARDALLNHGADWLAAVRSKKPGQPLPTAAALGPDQRQQIIENLKDFALHFQDAAEHALVKELLKRAKLSPLPETAFRLLVKLGVWREDENTYLLQHDIPIAFAPAIEPLAIACARQGQLPTALSGSGVNLEDLRRLDTFTIDSAATRDYDDALSLEPLADGRFQVGVHIADVAACIQPGDPIDQEARTRATSVYLPDQRIPMLPTALSENFCSLLPGADRPALSFLMTFDGNGNVCESRIVSSLIRVKERFTYEQFNTQLEAQQRFQVLHQFSLELRRQRLEQGAVILPLPEIQVYVNSAGMIRLHQYLKESPSQIVVSEWMIAANQLAAAHLTAQHLAGIFRRQAECKPETQPVMSEHALFQSYRQRRLFARAELDTQPGPHCSLGVPHYTSITSPIRRYVDLISQRQLKHALATATALYDERQLQEIIMEFKTVSVKVMLVQRKWIRYWLLKYIEQEDIQQLNALVLEKNARFAHLLLPDFLIEANLPIHEDTRVQPGELVRVRIDQVNPREDVLRLALLPQGGTAQ